MKTSEDWLNEYADQADQFDYGKAKVVLYEDALTIMEQYAEQFKPKWIKVGDALPETAERFYLTVANGGSIFLMYYGMDNNSKLVWWHDSEPVKAYLKPTHWQPLPSPPQM